MKTKLLSRLLALPVLMAELCSASALAATATPDTEAVIAEGLQFLAKEGWTAAEAREALESLRRLYVNMNKTGSGRALWHGNVTNSYTDVSNGVRVVTYEDGEEFRDTCSVSAAAVEAKAVAAIRSQTNGVPARLAAARAARDASTAVITNTVTVTITAGQEIQK